MSFALYGLVKKVVVADPRVSVAVETFLALPLAGGYLIALAGARARALRRTTGAGHTVLLMLAGPVTAVPLLLFAAAAQRLPLVTMGLLFYLNPALQMAWGVLVGHEPMPRGPVDRVRADLGGAGGDDGRRVAQKAGRGIRSGDVDLAAPESSSR